MRRAPLTARALGQPLNLAPPTCPPGYHWEVAPTGTGPIQGLAACVPNHVLRIVLPPPAPAAAPRPPRVIPIVLPPAAVPVSTPAVIVSSPAPAPVVLPPAATATAPAPARAPAPCPPEWPLWWLLVAIGAGVGVGYWVAQDKARAKKNAARFLSDSGGRIVRNAGGAMLASLGA